MRFIMRTRAAFSNSRYVHVFTFAPRVSSASRPAGQAEQRVVFCRLGDAAQEGPRPRVSVSASANVTKPAFMQPE
jgi:hypothetical protein